MSKFDQYLEMVTYSESSYDSFIANYGQELHAARGKLYKIGKVLETANDEQLDKLKQAMLRYDNDVDKTIQHLASIEAHHRGAIDINDIASFAIDNMNKFGTEPQFVLFAIDDAARALDVVNDKEEEVEE